MCDCDYEIFEKPEQTGSSIHEVEVNIMGANDQVFDFRNR